MANPVIFLKTSWMDFYDGRPGDLPRGKFRHVQEYGEEHADRNFLRQGLYCYGYAPHNNRRIRLDRHFGAAEDQEYVDGVDVVFIAKAPDRRGVVVVGWYKNARLFAEYFSYKRNRVCLTKALAKNCKLIPSDARWLQVKNSPRMANIWYADKEAKLKDKVRRLMAGTLKPPSRPKRVPSDSLHILRVERAAVTAVMRRLDGLGFRVTSVEKDRVGWDLEAVRAGASLKIEVKGCSGGLATAELTPNEFAACRKKGRDYRICIVTDSLTRPQVHIFSLSRNGREWFDETGKRELAFHRVIAARVTAR